MSRKGKLSTGSRRGGDVPLSLILVGVVVVGVIVVGMLIFRPAPPPSAGVVISVDQVAEKYKQGVFILDVRTPEEWAEAHIPGSTLIPLDELEARASEVPTDQEIVVICRSGNRSMQGQDILVKLGYQNVSSMTGGIQEWISRGYVTVSGP
jgi:rhodanese-related sulfurtransferase